MDRTAKQRKSYALGRESGHGMVRRYCWRMTSPRCTLAGALRCTLVSPVQQQADERGWWTGWLPCLASPVVCVLSMVRAGAKGLLHLAARK